MKMKNENENEKNKGEIKIKSIFGDLDKIDITDRTR